MLPQYETLCICISTLLTKTLLQAGSILLCMYVRITNILLPTDTQSTLLFKDLSKMKIIIIICQPPGWKYCLSLKRGCRLQEPGGDTIIKITGIRRATALMRDTTRQI